MSKLLPVLALLGLAACAHDPARATTAAAAPRTVVATGSRLPVRVDSVTGQPLTTSEVYIYSRDDLLRTGIPGNLGTAMMHAIPTGTLGPAPTLTGTKPALEGRKPSENPLPDEQILPAQTPPHT
jgi:hypothetical protein